MNNKSISILIHFFSFLFMFLLSCKDQKKIENNESNIILSKGNDVLENKKITSIKVDLTIASSLKYSEIFSQIDYKLLEAPDGIIVGKTDKLIEAENLFFLKSNGKIFIFRKNGRFLSKVDQQGEGPNQYRAITDFIVDTLTHRIEILDNRSFSVFEFDFNGKFSNTWKHGILSFQFYKISQDKYLFYADKELSASYNGRFLLYDRAKEKVTSYYLPIDRRRIKYEGFLDVNNFFSAQDEVLISCSGNDNIFSFRSGKIRPKYIFDFGVNSVPDDFYDKKLESVVEFNNGRIKNEFAGLYYNSFGENDSILVAQIVKAKTVYYLWLNKKNKNYRLINRFVDDLVFKGTRINVGLTFPTFFGNKKALRVLEPEAIMTTLDSIQKSSSSDEWNSLLKQNPKIRILHEKVKLVSNPVIQVMTYK
jgi:hypothetical protein